MKVSAKLSGLFAQLDALYAELPTIVCKGKCAIACGGGIVLTDLEARRLQLATHRKPRTTTERGRCVYLTAENRCGAYAVRPLICRAWGLVRMLSCMHGCVPDRWLKDQEFLRLAQAIEKLGGGRVLRTTLDGLAHAPDESFSRLPAPTRSDADIEADAERTRNLRALHGGIIILATTKGIDCDE